MRYVVDSAVVIKTVLPEPDSDRARSLLALGAHQLIAPDILPVEVAHALTRAERRRLLAPGEAALEFTRVLAIAPVLMPTVPLLARAIELSSQTRTGVYDCLYVALAEREDCELVTADLKLINALKGYPIRELSALQDS